VVLRDGDDATWCCETAAKLLQPQFPRLELKRAETPSSEDCPSGLHYVEFGLASVAERTDRITRVFVTLRSIPVYYHGSGPVRFTLPRL
jgi:hypothetical protein